MLIGLSHGWVAAQTLNLGQLIQLAIDTHPSVRAQLSNEKSAQSGIETAQYQRYPTPQLSYESVKKNSADPSYIGSDGVATVRITQPIFTGGQFTAQLDKAKANLQLSQASVRETRRQIALKVVQAYSDWSSAELKAMRVELAKDLSRLQAELKSVETEMEDLITDAGDGAGDDQADSGTKTFEREHEMSLVINAQDMVLQTERALARIDDKSYGNCEVCSSPIGKARLQVFPRATLCMICKQKEERR